MTLISRRCSLEVALGVTLGLGLVPGSARAQASAQLPSHPTGQPAVPSPSASERATAAKGVQCPAGFETLFDAVAKVLRCRREVVTWVVTGCPEKGFAAYVAKPGADSCQPTEIPGVGAPPGSTGSRAVACASPGYTVVVDRTGPRDRCERIERVFSLPRATP